MTPLKLALCFMLFMTVTHADENIYGDEMFTDDTETIPRYNDILDLIFDRALIINAEKETEITAADIILPMITKSSCRDTIKSRIIFPEIFDETANESKHVYTNHCLEEYNDNLKITLNISRFATKYILDDIIKNGNEENYIQKFNNASKILNKMEKYCLREIEETINKKELCMCYATNSSSNHCKKIIDYDQMNKTMNVGIFVTIGLIFVYYFF
jgi:hypothetical protein